MTDQETPSTPNRRPPVPDTNAPSRPARPATLRRRPLDENDASGFEDVRVRLSMNNHEGQVNRSLGLDLSGFEDDAEGQYTAKKSRTASGCKPTLFTPRRDTDHDGGEGPSAPLFSIPVK